MTTSDDVIERLKARATVLERSLDAYRSAFDASPLGIAISSPEGRFLEVNPAALRLFGMRRDEVIGRTSIEVGLIGAGDREHAAIAHRIQKEGSMRNPSRTIRTKSGEQRDLVLMVDLIEVDGEPRLLSTFFDIAEHRRVFEKAPSVVPQGPRGDTTQDGVCISDAQGRFTFVNPRLAELLGYEREALLGTHFSALLDEEPRVRAEHDQARLRRGTAESEEFKVRRADGQTIWVHFQSTPIFDARGQYNGTLATVVDITARIRGEEALRRSEAQLDEAQELAQIGSWEWDLRTNKVTRSRQYCRILGGTHEEFGSGMRLLPEKIHPDDRDHVEAAMQRAMRGGQSWVLEYRIFRPDGVRRLHARGEVEVSETGEPVRMFGTVQDITDWPRAASKV